MVWVVEGGVSKFDISDKFFTGSGLGRHKMYQEKGKEMGDKLPRQGEQLRKPVKPTTEIDVPIDPDDVG